MHGSSRQSEHAQADYIPTPQTGLFDPRRNLRGMFTLLISSLHGPRFKHGGLLVFFAVLPNKLLQPTTSPLRGLPSAELKRWAP